MLGAALVASTTRSLVQAGVAALGVMVVCIAVALTSTALPPSLRYGFVWKQTCRPRPGRCRLLGCRAALACSRINSSRCTGRTVALLAIAVRLRFTVSAWT